MRKAIVLWMLLLMPMMGRAAQGELKPRLVVCTDIAPADVEPDDMESMVRLMAYADLFEIEALITSVGWNCDPYPAEWAQYLFRVIDAYRHDVTKLMRRSSQQQFLSLEQENGRQFIGYWPSADYLRSRAVMGSVHGGIKAIGETNDSPGSELLIRLADEDDTRPIYVAAWGGANTLAQAIWRVKQTRPAEELKRFVRKFRIYTITDQDMQYSMRMNRAYSSHQWLRQEFADDLQFIWDEGTWQEQCELGKRHWQQHKDNIQGKGALGKEYPTFKWGVEGDTPSFLYLMPNGLNNPEDPHQAGWAGYHERGLCADSLTTAWTSWEEPLRSVSVGYKTRFYPDELNDFCARMQWADEGRGNRNPCVTVNGSNGIKPLYVKAKVGESIRLDASKSIDPDGDDLSFRWWQQPEIGKVKVDINQSDQSTASVNIPAEAAGQAIHIICEVHDNSPFHLVSYRRIFILTASPLTLHYDKPADYFEEALVIGNGTMGGIVYGGTTCDRISLNDITLWTGEPCNMNIYSPDAHKTIPAIRETLRKGDYKEADRLQREVQGHFSQNYQPLGQLSIEYQDTTDKVSNYHRWLDISDATAHTDYCRGKYHYATEYFVTHPDSGMVIRITTDSPKGIHARFSLSCQLRHTVMTEGQMMVIDGYAGYASLPSYYDAKEKFAYDPNRGIHFCTKVKVVATNVKVDDNALVVEGAPEVTLYVVDATSFNGYDKDPVKEGKPYRQLADARQRHLSGIPYDEVRRRHVSDYKNIFDRVQLSLGSTADNRPTDVQLREYIDESRFNPSLEALYFQYGRYLLISCSRTPNVPANLQGLWNESILPPWSCNYTSNINVEENYWAAETAALPEMHQSLFTYMKELQGSGELTAKAYYGVERGWCLAHNTDIWAMTCPVGLHTGDPMWANWNMGGAWLSTHIWEHYTFSLDRDFLREYYPVLKGAAEFCLGWLVSSKDMGVEGKEYLITAPSTSPENVFVTPEGYHGRTCYGGFADLAMIRECLSDARNAAVVLGLDRDFVAEADDALSRLQPYKIGHKGNLQEWFYDWEDEDPHHRHQSHLFGIYPGHHLDDGVNTKENIFRAASRTLELKGDRTTGWSTGWRVNLYARLHDAGNAYHIYRKLLSYVSPDAYRGPDARRGGGTYPNLLDAHSPFQIDGNFGGCAGVVEMLLQSEYTVHSHISSLQPQISIELLPALPANWKDGSVRGLRCRGGITVDMTWRNCRVTALTLTSKNPCIVMLKVNGLQREVEINHKQELTVEDLGQ